MGSTLGTLDECIEDIARYDDYVEEILEPLARDEFVSDLTSGLTTVKGMQALQIIGVSSLAVIRCVANNDDSGEEVFDEYEAELGQSEIIEAFEDFSL